MLLIHICCAGCGLKLIDAVKKEINIKDEDLALYFYNPNIHPESEHLARQKAVQHIASNLKLKLILENWTPKDWFNEIDKLKNNDSLGVWKKQNRCPLCWELRLTKTFKYAKDFGYDTVSSTLLTSIYHDADTIKKIGEKLSNEFKIPIYIPKQIDHFFKASGFYKQNYEGCIYSLVEKMEGKYIELKIKN